MGLYEQRGKADRITLLGGRRNITFYDADVTVIGSLVYAIVPAGNCGRQQERQFTTHLRYCHIDWAEPQKADYNG